MWALSQHAWQRATESEQVEDLQRWGVVTAALQHGALGEQEVENLEREIAKRSSTFSSTEKTAWTILFHGNFNRIRLSLDVIEIHR